MGGYGIRRLNGAPLNNSDGTVTIFCRKCGRGVSRRLDTRITSITECAVCQGYPEEAVVSPYTQQNIYSAPVPTQVNDDYMYLYGGLEDMSDGMSQQPKREEAVGTVKTVFRALGNFLRSSRSESRPQSTSKSKSTTESKKVAIRKRRKSVFSEPED